ncbi:MAG: SDR family NAD(P)-dependent oxidoreductase [Bacteroidia bacterium]
MNIIVTGASKGIGYETVLALSKEKQHHIIAMARDKDLLFSLQETCFKLHQTHITCFPCDIRELPVSQLQEVLAPFGKIDVLINNAGLLIQKPFLELSLEDWQTSFEVNLFGAARLIQILFPYLQKSEAAHIVNIGSMGGFTYSQKFEGLAAYSTSKAALANLTECLAVEMAAFGIKSNCLCLGAVNTELMRQAFPTYTAPLDGKDIAQFIADFALNGHKYMNGKVLPISLSTP